MTFNGISLVLMGISWVLIARLKGRLPSLKRIQCLALFATELCLACNAAPSFLGTKFEVFQYPIATAACCKPMPKNPKRAKKQRSKRKTDSAFCPRSFKEINLIAFGVHPQGCMVLKRHEAIVSKRGI